MSRIQIRGLQTSARVLNSSSSPTSNIDFLNSILKKVNEVNSVQNNVKRAAAVRKGKENKAAGPRKNFNNNNKRNNNKRNDANRRSTTSYQVSSDIDITTLDASAVATNFGAQRQARNGNRNNRTSNKANNNRANNNRKKDIHVYQKMTTGAQNVKPSEYVPQKLSPDSLLKYSSLVPVNKDMRILNAALHLLNTKKNGNVEFLNNEELLANIGTLMKIQQKSSSQLYAEPTTSLATSANRSISEVAGNNLNNMGCVRPMRHFSNILKDCQIEKEDLQTFKEIVNGTYSMLNGASMLQKLPKKTKKSVLSLEIAENSLNSNSSFDQAAKLKAFAPCAGVKSVKELLKDN